MPTALNAALRAYERQFEAIRADVQDLTAGLSDAQFNWRPDSGRWSIAQCLGHLLLSGEGALPVIDKIVADGWARGVKGDGPFRYSLLVKLLIWSLEPPYRLRTKTGPRLHPPAGQARTAVVPRFVALQDQVIERLHTANGLNLRALRYKPAGLPSLSVAEWLGFVAAHERRHLWQARNVRNEPGFPSIDGLHP